MSESEDLAKQLEELRKQMLEYDQEIAPLTTAEEKIKEAELEARRIYEAAIAAAREKKRVVDEQLIQARRKKSEMQQKQRQLELQIEEARKKAEAQAKAEAEALEFAAMEKKWDLLTAGAPWREWAKDHQISGGKKIVQDRKVLVADPMGLGKTLTAIIACDLADAATRDASPEHPFLGESKTKREYIPGDWDENGTWVDGHYVDKVVIEDGVERPCGHKILYICPSPLLRNVEREFRMWAKHRNVTFVGGMAKKEREFVFNFVLKDQAQYVVVCNYEAWRKDLKLLDQLNDCGFDTVIIDEAHNIKDQKTIAYRGVKQLLDTLQPPYVIPMTGTPILNRPQELFSLLTLVNPQKFWNERDFLFRYCEQTDDGFWKFKPGGLDLIAPAISKNFMRRTKDQAGIVLPDKTVTVHELEVDEEAYPNQARVRNQMRQYATIMIDEKQGKALAAAAMIAVFTRLRQIETWPAGIIQKDPITKEIVLQVDVEESQKLDYVIRYDTDAKQFEGLIPDTIEDERIVLFSQFKAPLLEIKDRVERMGKRAVILHGDTPADLRDEIGKDFDRRHTKREDAKWDIVLCNYKVGGVGLNLTAATQMIILDEEWNPGKRDQAYDRIHRIGQEDPVTIHVIRNLLTIDDWLAGIMEAKEGLVEGFNNKMISVQEFKDALDSGLI